MESNIATLLSDHYHGNLVHTYSQKVLSAAVELTALNSILIKVKFEIENHEYAFRAMLSDQEEGILMMIEDRITKAYMISGLSGFLYKKPNVHGGLISKLNSFYFHVQVQRYDGSLVEVYFLGKEEEEFMRMQRRRSDIFRNINSPYTLKDKSNL